MNIIDTRKKFTINLNNDIQLNENENCLTIQQYIDYLSFANCDIFRLKLLLAKIRERVNLISTFVDNVKEYKNEFDACHIILPNYNNLPNPIITQSNISGVIKIYFNDYSFLENSVIDYVFIEISNSINNLKAFYVIDKNNKAVYDIKSVIYAFYNSDLNSNTIGNLLFNFKYIKNYTIVKSYNHTINANDLYPFPITTLFIFTPKLKINNCFNGYPSSYPKYIGSQKYLIPQNTLNYFTNTINYVGFINYNNQQQITLKIHQIDTNLGIGIYYKTKTVAINGKETAQLKVINVNFNEKEFFENANLYI